MTSPRMRVIVDNDFSGDPDGLFQLAHLLLSPSVEIRGIIGSHLTASAGFDGANESATKAKEQADKIIKEIFVTRKYKAVAGSNEGMDTMTVAKDSEGAQLIIKEAMRTDTKLPLYVLCGAGLTDIASAWLLQPEIAKHLTLIWIGGQEYEGTATPPPGYSTPEYNLNLCIPAAQTIFNLSDIPIWQVPRNAYRQCVYSLAELYKDVKPAGSIGQYLYDSIYNIMTMLHNNGYPTGETYVLGDSPLVSLTALQSTFEPDPSANEFILKQSPWIAKDGTYRYNQKGRLIRVYTRIDTRLIYQDMIAKLYMNYPYK
jgi:inosine-uridine nucleoside N-ribohydrolase